MTDIVPLDGHLEQFGMTCAVCRTDIAAGGVGPGDGHLYCHPCYRAGKRFADPIDGQLELFEVTS